MSDRKCSRTFGMHGHLTEYSHQVLVLSLSPYLCMLGDVMKLAVQFHQISPINSRSVQQRWPPNSNIQAQMFNALSARESATMCIYFKQCND